MKKKVKVHLLPTEKAKLYIDGRKLYYNPTTMHIPVKPQPQHLYFTSDEKIEEGDWALYLECGTNDEPLKDAYPYLVEFPDESHWNDRKIVATTDDNLFTEDDIIPHTSLPQIPQSFIKEYVKSGGKIDEVEIELDCYEDRQCECKNNSDCLNIGIKVDSNNCVITHTIKDSWSRREHIEGMWQAYKLVALRNEFNNWIKENMK